MYLSLIPFDNEQIKLKKVSLLNYDFAFVNCLRNKRDVNAMLLNVGLKLNTNNTSFTKTQSWKR